MLLTGTKDPGSCVEEVDQCFTQTGRCAGQIQQLLVRERKLKPV